MNKRLFLHLLMFLEGLIALFAVCCALFCGLSTRGELKKTLSETASQAPETVSSQNESGETSTEATSETESTSAESTETETDTQEESTDASVPDETENETPAASDTSESDTPAVSDTSESDAPAVSFDQVVFVGDSRTLSLASGGTLEYRLVPDDAVCATWGGQLNEQSAHDNAKNAALMSRRKAIFWYGINDVQLNPDRDNPACFIANYDRVIATYLSVKPDSELYFLSVLDTSVNEKDYYEGQSENIAKYNQALSDYCTEHSYHFIDITALFSDDIFAEGDNIHFSKEWYEEKFLPAVVDQAALFAE